MRITKRDGTLQEFDKEKIARAMRLAAEAVYEHEIDLRGEINLVSYKVRDGTTVEEIQDEVEKVLMGVDSKIAKAYILYRAKRAKLRDRHPGNMLSEFIHPAKYARSIGDRRETYEETVDRVFKMHAERFPHLLNEIGGAFEFVYAKKVLPSMRSMQFAGAAIEAHNARMFNCSFTLCDRPEVFSRIFYLLLCGCGVGFSVQERHTEKLPIIKGDRRVQHWLIEDNIEGWADALDLLFASYVTGFHAEFAYSKIRSEGSPLKTSGGFAPGHLPLKRLLETVRSLLDQAVGRQLRPIEVYDIICHIGEAVLAGGIRRSSLIALFSPKDEEMLYAKYGNFPTQRAMSNNSAIFLRGGIRREFERVIDVNRKGNGEPGFFFTDNLDHGTNPCGEIGLNPVYESSFGVAYSNETGFAFCNLCEINGARCNTSFDLIDAAKAAAVIGTLQATYTSFPYLGEVTERIAERDRLLGVSIAGIMDSPEICLAPHILRQARNAVCQTNVDWSMKLKIVTAKAYTCVKPGGTAPLLLNASSGITPHHAKRYFRRVTLNRNETIAKFVLEHNPHMVEEKPNGDLCVVFPVEASGRVLSDFTALKFMDMIALVYDNWVTPPHNVSATVVFEKWDGIVDKIWENQRGAMAFFPVASDKAPFMPRESVATEADEAKWKYLLDNYSPMDYSLLAGDAILGTECGGSCEV